MLCDGRIVCGCADPYGRRPLGDARTASVHEIWTGRVISQLRSDLNDGGSQFCGDCPLKLPLRKGEAATARALDAGPLPSRMYIECTAACNISCAQACCAPETGITRTRQAGMLDFDLFTRVVDEVGTSLVRIDFFNYGEAFLHKRAVDMCEYIKSRFPSVYLYTSTNGLALSEPQARRLVHSGIDEVTFSIDGATQETYARYRQRGRLETALANLRAMADEKRRTGRDLPFLNWRYILFYWNDGDAEMTRARELAAEIGVDRLCWELTDHPEDCVLPAVRARFGRSGSDSPRNMGRQQPGKRNSWGDTQRADRRAHVDSRGTTGGASRPAHPGSYQNPELIDAPVPRPRHLRPQIGPTGRAIVRRRRRRPRPRLRTRLAARCAWPRRGGGRAD